MLCIEIDRILNVKFVKFLFIYMVKILGGGGCGDLYYINDL